jgi:integrase
MARVYLMSWDGKNRRWLKEYTPRGGVKKKYAVSCRQLGLPRDQWTMDRSYQAANEWWKQKQDEIDAAHRPAVRPPLPLEDLAQVLLPDPAALSSRLAAALAYGRLQAEREADRQKVEAEDDDADPVPPTGDEDPNWAFKRVIQMTVEDVLQRMVLGGEPVPAEVAAQLPPARVQQLQDAVKSIRGEPAAAPEKTVASHYERWVSTQQALVAAGQRSAAGVDNSRICLYYFRDFLGGQADVGVIDAPKLHNFFLWCLRKVEERQKDSQGKAGWSEDYAKKVFGIARAFIRWLAEQGAIDLPRNIDSKGFRFNAGVKAVQTWTVKEFQTALAAATGQLRLHLLLMANCGFTQVDISDLKDTEVDWVSGRIIRKRSKTAKHEQVPVVNYRLWPLTFELLKQYRSGGERVLLTESGKPWVREELVNGELVKSDNIRSNYAHLVKKLKGFNKPPKLLRKTAASLLDSHPEFGRYSQLFLGHSPRTVADRHYISPSQERFDEAVLWLGRQLGQVQ